MSKVIAEIDQRELQVRLLEAFMEIRRPDGVPVLVILENTPPDAREASRRAAVAALEYFRECIAQAHPVS